MTLLTPGDYAEASTGAAQSGRVDEAQRYALLALAASINRLAAAIEDR